MADVLGSMGSMFGSIFLGFGLVILLAIMGATLYFFDKFMKERKAYPVTVVLLEVRQKNLTVRLDKSRREIASDGKESYLFKNLKKRVPAPSLDVAVLTPTGGNVLFALKIGEDDIRFLKLDELKKEFQVLIPEDAKMWYMDQQRKRAEMWKNKDKLRDFLFMVTPLAVIIVSLLMFMQMYNMQQTSLQTIESASKYQATVAANMKEQTKLTEEMNRQTLELLHLFREMNTANTPE